MPYKLVSRQQWLELLFGYINSITCAHGITSWGQDNVLKNLHLVLNPGGPLGDFNSDHILTLLTCSS